MHNLGVLYTEAAAAALNSVVLVHAMQTAFGIAWQCLGCQSKAVLGGY